MAELYDMENTLQQWENFVSIIVEHYHKTNLQQWQNFTVRKIAYGNGRMGRSPNRLRWLV